MLVISKEDVERLLPMRDCIGLMEQALAGLARGEALLPLRTIVSIPEQPNFFAVMPAYASNPAAIAVKVLTVFPGNHGTGIDSHQGAVLLFDPEHGRLEAILDATSVTAIRTAAVSAVATRLLAREDAHTLAVIGSGTQGRMHVEAIPLVRDIREIRIWSRTAENARALAEHAATLGLDAKVLPTAEEAVRGADVVCTVTASHEPVVHGAWLEPGAHVNAVGTATPTARELDTEAIVRSKLYVDRRESALNEPGDILVPLAEGAITADHVRGEIGELLIGRAVGRESDAEITLFKSLGLAVEDLAAAHFVVEQGRARGVGTVVGL